MYGKLFSSMYDGTLYGQWQAIVTLQQLVILADADGVVDMTPPAIAARTSIPMEIIEAGIEQLSQADKYSRSEAESGRRIVAIDPDRPWGWQIVNYAKYRDMRSAEDRKAYMREYMREKRKQEKLTDVNGKQLLAPLANTDTDTDIDISIGGKVANRNEAPKPEKSGKKKATRAPADFWPTPEDFEAMRVKYPHLDLETETESMKDFEFKTPKSDWRAAWRNWIRRADTMKPRPKSDPDWATTKERV